MVKNANTRFTRQKTEKICNFGINELSQYQIGALSRVTFAVVALANLTNYR